MSTANIESGKGRSEPQNTEHPLEQLKQYPEYIGHLLNASQDLFFVFDRQARLRKWNDKVAEVTGHAGSELKGMEAVEFIAESARERVSSAIDRVFEKTHAKVEAPLLTAGGEEIPYEFTGDLAEHPDGDLRFVGVGRDISELKRRERQLQRAKKEAEEANRMKSFLLSNMNHEMRTPLTSIITFGHLIEEAPEQASTFVGRVASGGERLLYVLNTAVDFVRIEEDKIRLNPEEVDVGTLIASVAEDFQGRAERKKLTIETNRPDTRVTALLDKHYTEQVCAHLMSNAIKFTEEPAGHITLGTRENDQSLTLWVQDHGIGMQPSFLPRATEAFAQAKSKEGQTHRGNGLGLAVAKRLVEQMGGTLNIESTPGEGTRVAVSLPTKGPRAD